MSKPPKAERISAVRDKARLDAQQARERKLLRAWVGGASAVAAIVAGVVVLAVISNNDDPAGTSSATAGLQTGPPPWPAQPRGLNQRIAALNFPPVGDESYHAHALLTVYRDGQQVPVPQNIGFDERGAHASLHTHTPDGVIHMEADDPYPYELSHVFQVWGVTFSRDRLGGDTASGDKKIHVYVNGEPAPTGPVVLRDGDNVVVAYGTDGSFDTLPPADVLTRA